MAQSFQRSLEVYPAMGMYPQALHPEERLRGRGEFNQFFSGLSIRKALNLTSCTKSWSTRRVFWLICHAGVYRADSARLVCPDAELLGEKASDLQVQLLPDEHPCPML